MNTRKTKQTMSPVTAEELQHVVGGLSRAIPTPVRPRPRPRRRPRPKPLHILNPRIFRAY